MSPERAPRHIEHSERRLRSVACSSADQLATFLIDQRQYDDAVTLYKALPGVDKDCSERGLAMIARLKALSESTSDASRVGAVWAEFVALDLAPLEPPVLAGLSALLILLVAGRLITPAAVAPAEVSWPPGRRRGMLRLALGLLFSAVAVPIRAESLGRAPGLPLWPVVVGLGGTPRRLGSGLVVALLLLAALLSWDSDRWRQKKYGDGSGQPHVLLTVGLLVGAGLGTLSTFNSGSRAAVSAGLMLGVVGVATPRGCGGCTPLQPPSSFSNWRGAIPGCTRGSVAPRAGDP